MENFTRSFEAVGTTHVAKSNLHVIFIVPAYNEEALLPQCLASIFAEARRAIAMREISGYDVIVVDNASTDATASIARAYGAIVEYCSERGLTRARQAGFDAAQIIRPYGAIHAYIDADNIVPPHWVSSLKYLQIPNVVAVSGPLRFMDQSKTFQMFANIFYAIARAMHYVIGPTIQGGNFALNPSALKIVGGHSTGISFYGEDTDLAARLSTIGKVWLVPDMWIYASPRRIENQGLWSTVGTYILNYVSVSILGRPVTHAHKDFRA